MCSNLYILISRLGSTSILSSVNAFLIVIVIGIEIDGEERWDGMGWEGAHLGGTCTQCGYIDADR